MDNVSQKIVDTYSYLYLPHKKENYDDNSGSSSNISIVNIIFWVIFIFAIYLSFRCNKGFNIWGFLGAFFFSPIYVVYKLATTEKLCGLMN